ncbi:MAG: HAD hydrolase-like protein, partial [Hyphomicrobiaceae bacterium]
SGDAARGMIADLAPRPVYHLGPERDLPLFAGLDVSLVALDAAQAVVCTGLFDDETETPATYAPMLAEMRARLLPMVCANPDLKVERGERIVWCAGGVAAAYEALGGVVTYAGKPHAPVYDMADRLIAELRGTAVPRSRLIAIGDGIKTDIAGASSAGIRSIYVASGVHLSGGTSLDPDALAALFDGLAMRPVAAMQALAW